MNIAIYPGSFDPVTKGHLNIIERASKIFDKLIVCVMVNGAKRPIFTSAERVDFLERVTSHLDNVQIDASSELLADYARRMGSSVIIKGLRAATDFENEFQMALINRKLNPGLDTMFLTAEHQYMFMSSSVKETGNTVTPVSGTVNGKKVSGEAARQADDALTASFSPTMRMPRRRALPRAARQTPLGRTASATMHSENIPRMSIPHWNLL